MAITAETRTDIIDLVVAALDVAPGTTLLSELVAIVDGGGTLADVAANLTARTDYLAKYPTFQTANEWATEWLGNLIPEADSTTMAAAVTIAEGMINSGSTQAAIIVEAASFLAGATADATYGTVATAFVNNSTVAAYHTVEKETTAIGTSTLSGVDSTAASVTTAKAAVDTAAAPTVASESFTLTKNLDTKTTGAGADSFSSDNTSTANTLTAGDNLNGGDGADTLTITNTVANAALATGVTAAGIETVYMNAVAATTLDMSLFSGVTDVHNNGSLADLTLSGVGSYIPNIHLTSTSTDTTVNWASAATVVGTADAMTVALNAAALTSGATLTANGIETFNVLASTASGTATNSQTLVSTSARTVTITGDATTNLTVNLAGAGATTALAGTVTGNDAANITSVTADSTDVLTVDLGKGDDTLTQSSIGALHTLTGGDGTDTLALTQAVATGISSKASVTGWETLNVSDAGTGTIDMDSYAGVTKVIYDAGLGAATTVDDAVTGIEVEVDATATAQNLTVDLKTDGSTDAITVTLDTIAAGDNIGTLNASDAETLTINVDDDTLDATGTIGIASITLGDATTVNVTGDAATTVTAVTNPTTAVLATLNAGTMTDSLTISGVNLVATGATVTLGAGNDSYTAGTGDGADTIDISAGGKDTIVYTALAQSDAAGVDTIKGFVSGSDDINLTGMTGRNVVTTTQFGGVGANKTGAEALLGGTNSAVVVFQADENLLWVDIDANGTLNASDFRVKLDGVTTIAATDLALSGTGATVTLSAASASTATTGTATNANANTTNEGDTISSTIAFLSGSTITGGSGTDTLSISNAGAVGALPATITEVETLQLADGTNTGVDFNAAGVFINVTGGNGSDTIADTANIDAGGTISLGAGADVITDFNANMASTTIDMGADDDSLTSTVGAAITTTLKGGLGTDTLALATSDDISGATVSGFENLTVASGGSVVMTFAQYVALSGGTVTGAGSETITPSAAAGGTITLPTTIEVNDFSNVTSGVTADASGTANYTITGSGSADSITLGAAGDANDTVDTGAGTDTIVITGAFTGDAGYTNMETFDLNITSAAATVTAGAMDTTEDTAFVLTDSTQIVTLDMQNWNGATGSTKTLTVTDGAGNDVITLPDTIADRAATTVNLSTGGSDTLKTGTLPAVALAGNAATINNFTAGTGAGADILDVTFAAGTNVLGYKFATTLGFNVAAVENQIVVISGSIASVADLTDDADAGSVETQIQAAVDLTNLTDGDDIIVALSNFGGTSTGIYAVDVTDATGGATEEIIVVEHIMTLVGVDVDNLTVSNII